MNTIASPEEKVANCAGGIETESIDFRDFSNIHYGKTVVTGNSKEPKERNDYTSPISSGEYGALYRAGKGWEKVASAR
ncbi:hypothetical protein JOD24_003194 [Kroppenstedtia sanguinis]|uniref:hypothetical protein n=1 Tax=Kroppenstedtia sanguinis TaxID=1380684 RepID=UPI003D1B4142